MLLCVPKITNNNVTSCHMNRIYLKYIINNYIPYSRKFSLVKKFVNFPPRLSEENFVVLIFVVAYEILHHGKFSAIWF